MSFPSLYLSGHHFLHSSHCGTHKYLQHVSWQSIKYSWRYFSLDRPIALGLVAPGTTGFLCECKQACSQLNTLTSCCLKASLCEEMIQAIGWQSWKSQARVGYTSEKMQRIHPPPSHQLPRQSYAHKTQKKTFPTTPSLTSDYRLCFSCVSVRLVKSLVSESTDSLCTGRSVGDRARKPANDWSCLLQSCEGHGSRILHPSVHRWLIRTRRGFQLMRITDPTFNEASFSVRSISLDLIALVCIASHVIAAFDQIHKY